MLISLLVLSPLWCSAADSGLYDDFIGTGINHDKWISEGHGFTQPSDGSLHYSNSGTEHAQLISKSLFSSGVFTMQFADYQCSNAAPPAQGLGSVAALGLGFLKENQWVRIERGQIQSDLAHGITGGYIEVNWVSPDEPGRIHVNNVQSEWKSGFLQIRAEEKAVTFFYRENEITPWTQMAVTGRGGRPCLVIVPDLAGHGTLVLLPHPEGAVWG